MKEYLDIVKPWRLLILGVIVFFMYFDSLFAGSAMPVILGIVGVLAAALFIAFPFIKKFMGLRLRCTFELIVFVCYPFVMFLTYLFTAIAGGKYFTVLEWIIVIAIMIILLAFVAISILNFLGVRGIFNLVRFSVIALLGLFAFLLIFRVDGSFRTIGGIEFAELALYAILASIVLEDKPELPR